MLLQEGKPSQSHKDAEPQVIAQVVPYIFAHGGCVVVVYCGHSRLDDYAVELLKYSGYKSEGHVMSRHRIRLLMSGNMYNCTVHFYFHSITATTLNLVYITDH